MFIVKIMKYPIYMSLSYNPPTSNTKPTSVVVTSNTLVLVLLSSREHAHGMLLVSVLVSEVELKLSNNDDNTETSMDATSGKRLNTTDLYIYTMTKSRWRTLLIKVAIL